MHFARNAFFFASMTILCCIGLKTRIIQCLLTINRNKRVKLNYKEISK